MMGGHRRYYLKKWLGASVGYNFVPGGHYGECNFGVLFFFN